MSNLEILSPVGEEKSFYCAIASGADAVYLGLKNFNARDKAQNFNCENLRQYVEYAHLFGVKVYITVNTILTDEEIPEMLAMVKSAYLSKVDAFIVQDFGVAYILKNTFKNIVLHASTQMGIHSVEGAKMAEKFGFSRIVLSRETSLEDIKEIKKQTNLEIEYFVQGALCVCFSGNCYYSSLNFNESGNRGRCLQPCRLPFVAKSKDNEVNKGYLLSATDLCFINRVKQLKDAGVMSLKIEGRLRRPAYVSYATQAYVMAKMAIQNNSNFSGFEIQENLKKLFNRGEYNSGFYLNENNDYRIINPNYQNHRGVLIGTILDVKPFKDIYEILIVTNGYQISQNDGLKFVYKNNEQGIGVGGVKKANKQNHFYVYTKVKPKKESEVYLTVDNNWETELEKTTKKIEFSAYFEAKIGKKPTLKLKVGKVEISQILFDNLEKAKNQGLTYEDVKTCLEKTNETPFVLKSLKADIENVFMAKSQLNELRRLAIQKLQKEIIKENEKSFGESLANEDFYSCFKKQILEEEKRHFVLVNEKQNLEEILNKYGKKISLVLAPNFFVKEIIEKFLQSAKQKGFSKIYLDLPKVLRKPDFDAIKEILKCFNASQIGIVANNISHLYFTCQGYEVIGGVYLNIANSLTVKVLNDLGVKIFVKSFEGFANNFKLGLTYCGKPALMTFCHCPYKTTYKNTDCKECKFDNLLTYKSQSGKEFKIRRTKISSCIFELVNDEILNKDKEKNVFIDLR